MRALRIVFCVYQYRGHRQEAGDRRQKAGTYDDIRVPVADFGVVVFLCVGEGRVAGLACAGQYTVYTSIGHAYLCSDLVKLVDGQRLKRSCLVSYRAPPILLAAWHIPTKETFPQPLCNRIKIGDYSLGMYVCMYVCM